MIEKKTVWVAYTNTDLTEGRGRDIAIAVCAEEMTAKRRASKKYVQGCDGPVCAVELVKIKGEWYAPIDSIIGIEGPSKEDIVMQAILDAKNEALKKIRSAGLTDVDLAALDIGIKEFLT